MKRLSRLTLPLLRPSVVALCIAAAYPSLVLTAHAQMVAEARQTFDIPAGPLDVALTRIARQSGQVLSVSPELVRGLHAPAVQGELTPHQAYTQALRGSGLEMLTGSSGTVTVRQVNVTGRDAVLPAVTVSATHSAKTEGSGSYTQRGPSSTATGLGLTLRETPQSVSIMTSQLMEDKKIGSLMDVVEHATGLSVSRYESNRGSLFARGFNINNYLIDGAPTGINEQWSAGEVFSSTAIYDRIEVLRGSDGLMTGVGNPSAVINMIRKKADSKVLKGTVTAEAGSWSQRGLMADISTPLSESGSTRARFIADHDEGKSYIDRLKNRGQIFFATIEQDIGDHSLLSAGVSHQKNHTKSPTWGGIPGWLATNANNAVQANWGRNQTTAPNWSYWDSDYTNWFVRGDHDFGNGWHINASYTRGNRNSEAKIANFYQYGTLHPVLGTSFMHQEFFGFPFSTPMKGNVGLYHVDNVKEDINLQVNGQFRLFGRDHQLAFGYDDSRERLKTLGNPGNTSPLVIPNLYTWDGNGYEPAYTYPLNSGGVFINQEVSQKALYLSSRFSLADPLNLILGARVIDYSVTDYKDRKNDFKTSNEIIPYVGLVFDLNRNLSLYASHTNIFEPQSKRDASNKLLSPIEGNTREVGIKGAFLDQRLNASLSIFKMQQENVAKANGLIPGSIPAQTAYIELDGAVSKGYELEVVGEIQPGWNASIGYARFKAEAANGTDLNSLMPRRQFNAFTSYRLSGALSGLTIGGGVRWQSATYANAVFLPGKKLEQKAYSVVDLMARYMIDEKWSLQFNLNNALDRKYFAPPESGMEIFWQEPRNVQLSLKYQF